MAKFNKYESSFIALENTISFDFKHVSLAGKSFQIHAAS